MLPLVAGLKSADSCWVTAAAEVERGERGAHKAKAAHDTGVNKVTSEQ